MPAISVGSVEVDVVPNTQGIYNRLRSALVPAATRAGNEAGTAAGRAFGPAMTSSISDAIGERIGTQIGRQIAGRITASIRGSLRDGITEGGRAARPAATRQGADTGGAFARSLRARLEAAFRSMPKLNVGLNDTGVDADLARLRARLESLAGKTVGIDIDAATARAQAADIEERLRRIGAAHPNVAVRADTAAAIAQLQLLQQQIDETTRDPARVRVETDGTFGQRLRAQVQAAEASLPNINLTADSTDVDVEIARLRAQLTALRDVRIGVDMDTATATARIEAIQARLQRLAASDADVAVRVDASNAVAQLAAMQAIVNRLDGQTASVNVRVNGMQLLVAAAVAFGPAIIPALPVVAAGLGAVAAAATAAGVGIGAIGLVAAPAFKGIASALQAQKAAQDAASDATMRGGQASSQGAQKALQMEGAQQSLASAHRNAARQIAQAEQGVSDAVRSASESNRRAKQQLADAVQSAADRQRQSAEQVRRAEDSLADAQRSARQAQEDLNQARRDAAQDLAELTDRLANAQLSERDAVLSVQEAETRLRAVQAEGSTASLIEQERAQLAYDQAVQRLKESRAETKNLTAEKKAADKAGVEGSETVKDAQERLRQADEAVVDQQRELAQARSDAARQQIESQQAVAEAQRNVARTQEDGARSVARAQEQLSSAQESAAESIASAQRQIASASLSAAGGVDQAAIAQAKYQAELAKLTPAARETMTAYMGLRDAFSAWSKSLQPAVMPIFTRALNGLKNSLPGLTPFVHEAADAIKGLQDRASAGFKSPWWKEFKSDLEGSIKPAITGLGISFGRIFKGMAGIMQAFFPHMDSISERMQRITGRFANWGTSLKGSPEFERFLDYSSSMAPKLGDALRKIGGAFLSIGQALKPLSGPLLMLIGGLAEGIGIVADKAPWMIAGIYGIILATKLWTIATAAFNLVMKQNPIIRIAILIGLLVAAVIYAYNKFGWFRTAVQAAWDGIKTAALFTWNTILKPAFNGIAFALQKVGGWAMWLWNAAIKPAFNGIVFAGKILLTALVTLIFLPLYAAFKLVGWVAGWLWKNAIKPAFDGIVAAGLWLWNNGLKPAFDLLKAGLRAVGSAARWLYQQVIKPVFDSISDAISFAWTQGIKPAFNAVKNAMEAVLAPVFRWLRDKVVKPVWDGIKSAISGVWEKGIRPVFNTLKDAIDSVAGAFNSAKNAIKVAWDKVKGIAKAPIAFVIDTVYNGGIVKVWNKVADAFGAPTLKEFHPKGFASGGVLPGYTPGKDVHRFVSPTGGRLDLSGGEAIMRPEFTRAVGSGFVNTMNSLARSRGASGVKAALAPVFGGNPATSTDTSLRYSDGGVFPYQKFADGGIFGWIKSAGAAVAGAGSATWNAVKKGASWLKDTLEASARAGVKHVVDPLLRSFPGMDTGIGKMIRRIPDRIIDALFGYSKKSDDKGAGGIGGPRIQAALKWAKTQNGKPYQWGGNGNPSWDCSGFVSAIESVIRGQKPHRRWSTHAFSGRTAPPGWVYHGNSAFKVGITNAGVGHTAGTLGKTKVESRGGDGVIVGSRARGFNDRLFNSWYGFKPGTYDSGGYLQPGMNLAFNGTGRPEPVFTTSQANALGSLAARGATGPSSFEGNLFLDSGEFLGRVRGEAAAVMHEGQRQLIGALNAG